MGDEEYYCYASGYTTFTNRDEEDENEMYFRESKIRISEGNKMEIRRRK